jgi:hypothetical protein
MVGRNAPIDYDTYGHLYFAKEVKEQKSGPFGEIKVKVIGNDGFSHPFLLHWLIGIFPIDKVLNYQKLINPSLDSLFTVVIYIVSQHIGFNHENALLISALYIFTPLWFSNKSLGPRITSFTPRLYSEILSNIFFIITVLPLGLSYWAAIIIGTIVSCIAISSSKFGVQVLIFLTPIISVLLQSMTPVIALISGFGLAVLLSKGKILHSFKEQYSHLSNYYIKVVNGDTLVSNRNSFHKLFNSINEYKGISNKLMVVFNRMLVNNSFTGVLLKMPILLISFFLYIYCKFVTDIAVPYHLIMPVLAATIVFIVVNIPRFLFLGEAERYLNHVAYFIVASFVLLSIKASMIWLLFCFLGYGLIFWVIESIILTKVLPNIPDNQKKTDEVVVYLQNVKNESIISTYPSHAIGIWRLMLETPHKVISSDLDRKQGVRTKNSWYGNDSRLIDLKVIDRMHNELGVNVLIIDNKELMKNIKGWEPSILWTKNEIGFPYYTVYEING